VNKGDIVRWNNLLWFVMAVADSNHAGTDYNRLVKLISFNRHNTIEFLTDTSTNGHNISDATVVPLRDC
jgi:hypothetical protein